VWWPSLVATAAEDCLNGRSRLPPFWFGSRVVFQANRKITKLLRSNQRESDFMHRPSQITLAFALMIYCSPAAAQVTLDASKITCDQFVHAKVSSPRLVGAWLSGFYNGKRNNRIIDLQNFEANLSKLENFCYEEKNYKLPVMQAVEQVIRRGR
jgi:acid stress chaperone HdeB